MKVELRAEQGAVLRVSGAPYSAVLGSLARIRAALQSVHVRWPGKALTLHVHPPCRPEDFMHLDVPVALTLLALQGQVSSEKVAQVASTGTLSLDGKIHASFDRSSRAGLPRCSTNPVPSGLRLLVGPDHPGSPLPIQTVEAQSLAHLETHLDAWFRTAGQRMPTSVATTTVHRPACGWSELRGEGRAKTWLCIAARERLPVLMSGAPGVGKSSLARASKDLLTSPHPPDSPPPTNAVPFLAPHPTGGAAGLLGSWRRGQPIPGAWALAHDGLLFLDELPEWPKPAREGLRHLLETGVLDLHRAEGSARWTSNAWVLAAMNLCPCGQHKRGCVCTSAEKLAYRKRLTAPLLERFPVQLEVGVDESECPKTWLECRAWLARAARHKNPTWSREARDALASVIQSGLNSKRLQNHLKRLAEGHARWTERAEVSELDVFAAYDVTWMNRPGWRSDRNPTSTHSEASDTYF
ncbi:MAG: ATP-binding protein [Flavobacteriales bacterium]